MRLTVTFNDPPVVANDLGNESQTKTGAIDLGRDERLKEMWQKVFRHAGTIVLYTKLQRQTDPLFSAGNR